ncbi:MAG: hypothetical protein AAFV78_13315 [Bacteroidota bacterium]
MIETIRLDNATLSGIDCPEGTVQNSMWSLIPSSKRMIHPHFICLFTLFA